MPDNDAIRAAFEAWMGKHWCTRRNEDEDDDYLAERTEQSWLAWQAGYAAARNAKDTGGEG